MKMLSILAFGSVMLFLFTSCATPKKNLFVLMPDPDGKIGQIAVENKGGTQIIAQAGHATEVKDAATAPTPPLPMDGKTIKRIFGAALGAGPVPPISYILHFKTGSTDLTEESVSRLPEILSTIMERKSSDVSVIGHSDTVGAKQKNYELSLERARRVREILVSKGIDSQGVEVDSHGEDNLLVKTADEVSEPRNRRVEVTVR